MSDTKTDDLFNAVECLLKAVEAIDEKSTLTNEGLGHLVQAMREVTATLEKQELRITELENPTKHPRIH